MHFWHFSEKVNCSFYILMNMVNVGMTEEQLIDERGHLEKLFLAT